MTKRMALVPLSSATTYRRCGGKSVAHPNNALTFAVFIPHEEPGVVGPYSGVRGNEDDTGTQGDEEERLRSQYHTVNE